MTFNVYIRQAFLTSDTWIIGLISPPPGSFVRRKPAALKHHAKVNDLLGESACPAAPTTPVKNTVFFIPSPRNCCPTRLPKAEAKPCHFSLGSTSGRACNRVVTGSKQRLVSIKTTSGKNILQVLVFRLNTGPRTYRASAACILKPPLDLGVLSI